MGADESIDPDEQENLALLRARAAKSIVMMWLGRLAGVLGIGLMVALAALWMLHARLAEGPISVSQFMPQIAHDIENRIGVGYRVKMAAASIERKTYGATLAVTHFTLLDPQGLPIIDAPRAEVSLNLWTLPFGIIRPSRIEVFDLAVHLIVKADGSLAISAGNTTDLSQAETTSEPAPTPSAETTSPPSEPSNTMARPTHILEREVQNIIATLLTPEGILGGLEHVVVTHGSFYFDDRVQNQTTKFDNLELAYDKSRKATQFDIAADGPNGRWHIKASGDTLANAPRKFTLNIQDLSLDELNIIAGVHEAGFDFDMPISVNVQGELSDTDTLASIKGSMSIGAGFLFLRDPDQEPFWIDEATSHFVWNSGQNGFDISDLQIFSGETSLFYSGIIGAPRQQNDPWSISLSASPNSVIGPERFGDHKISLTSSTLKARYFSADKKIIFDEFKMNGPEISINLTGLVEWVDQHHHMVWNGVFTRVPTQVALMMWPSVSAAPVRNFMQEKLRGGMLDKLTIHADLDEESLTEMKYQRPPKDDAILVEFSLSNTSLAFLNNVPPLINVDAVGRVTGHTAHVSVGHAQIDLGGNKKLIINDGNFDVSDTGIKPTPAHITLHLDGTLDALGDFLARDALKNFGGVQIDTTTIKGQLESNVTIDMLLTKPDQDPHVSVKTISNVSNFSIDHLIGKERLDNGTLNVTYENNALHGSGQGRILGSQATIDINKPAGTFTTDASVSFSLDEAARAHLGFSAQGLSGTVGVRVTGALGQSDKATAQAELDFTKAAFEGIIPGLMKPAGRPSKASFAIVSDADRLHIEQLNFDAGAGLGFKGSADLDDKGALIAARLSQLKLSSGDDARADYDRTETGLKLVMRGASFDAHAFLARLSSADKNSADNEAPRDVDVDMRLGLVIGANKQALSNLDLRYSRRQNIIRQFQLNARQARAQVQGNLRRADDGIDQINITTSEAGAFLSFLDLYKRMEGGQLQLLARYKDAALEGTLNVNNFVVRDEPALRRIVAEGQERNASNSAQFNNINTNVAPFDRLQIGFVRSSGALILNDAVMYGQQIGMNIDGRIDFARDYVNLSGTFVPAYGLNNLFSKIPLFGPVLLGGQHQGLFALNFRINGPASAPVLTINPLSAIAPGFLRKIFGIIDGGLNNQMPAGSADMPMSITPQQRR
jgi:Protein of unknown function/AsmA-like C-terminal region